MDEPTGNGVSRRDLLKRAALGALAIGAVPTIFIPRRAQAYGPAEEVHPNINPLRVVGAQDAGMVNGTDPRSGWDVHDPMVVPDAVNQNMDRMAMALAEEKDAADAWKKIFLKPAGKGWGDVIVAIKTNQIAEQRTRSAVMAKVCHVLTDQMGVKAANVYIYDACHGDSMKGNPWKGLPDGVNTVGTWGSYNTPTSVVTPRGTLRARCLDHLAKGEVDILVNIALCKGHMAEFGNFTMCMKNHFGTFDPRHGHAANTGGANYVIGINRTPEILGKLDPATGKVLFPRNQLCVVDGLWMEQFGPGGLPSHQPNMLMMGTFAPAVDYLGALRVRKEMMGWRVNEQVLAQISQEFGFKDADLPNKGQIIDALAKSA